MYLKGGDGPRRFGKDDESAVAALVLDHEATDLDLADERLAAVDHRSNF